MNKILIIKNNSNDFETYFSCRMQTDNVDVMEPYYPVKKVLHYLRAICKKSKNHFLYGFWLGKWKKNLDLYDKVIVFDNCATPELLEWIATKKGKKQVILWLWNIPQNSIDKLEKYTKVVCFDKKYALEHNYSYVQQFYINKSKHYENVKVLTDIVFVGADKGRYMYLKTLAELLSERNIKYEFYVYRPKLKKDVIDDRMILLSDKLIPYNQVLNLVNKSKAILELNKSGQNGLTLRTMEALFYNRKLLTNNPALRECDFYRKSNIYIFDSFETRSISEFLEEPYEIVDQDILNQYSYANWLEKIINI